ncbi:YtxH domain-containing protein [Alkalibacterium kapii]|uniref:General stress protein n=1 Tax=Alkalibacterium kapii TaxID=426704 RepID=A0A511AX03_9LACT|nr:YtxH domain-containing protein [Alkalibacterium kapii]GEK92162.1 general stress protein [Alkalibacterium kapii]
MFIKKIGKVYEIKGFVLGTFVGASVAGLTALLLAPKSGKEVRNDIKQQTLKTKEQAKDYVEKAKDKGMELKDSVSKKSDEYAEKASESYEELTEQAEKNMDKTEENLNKIKQEAKETAEKVKNQMDNEEKSGKKNDPTVPVTTSRAVSKESTLDSEKSTENKSKDVKTDATYFNPENK